MTPLVCLVCKKGPADRSGLIPFITLRKLPSHKQKFLTRMSVHVGIEQTKIGKFLPIIPGHFREEGLFHMNSRSEEHTSELQSRGHLVCRLLLEKKKQKQ